MLETKNLSKIYKPKKGVPVTALDSVSLKFPDTGMVFLLGKSGSGKSTLLNLLGGLDKYDGGEIIIKGVSSKSFSQKHFDSYRNTYVGFIFQEYNVLEEFTVGANIALALELQNRKATDEEINKILDEVDLTGYGNRKPNELSGGQKQRVAIARALVKSPKIIMADEPTGALDSATGKQVFDTLKKLSKEKLVIVVSHDRDFASRYADRIIELADGKVINDSTLCENAETESTGTGLVFEGTTARISEGYHLTEEDRLAINAYIDKIKSGMALELDGKQSTGARFCPTDPQKIKHSDKTEFKLIKSKLSLKNSFKIGSSGLKHKKFRLVMTVILSCIAFVLFGLADTFGSYDHIQTTANSIYDTGVAYASLSKSCKVGEGADAYWNNWNTRITKKELEKLNRDTGLKFTGVWAPFNTELYFEDRIDTSVKLTETDYDIYSSSFSGFVEISESSIREMGYSLIAGRIPDGGKNEIAISEHVCRTFIKCGYWDGKTTYEEKGETKNKYEKITQYSDMIGKTVTLIDADYTIVGVVDTKFDFERYEGLTEKKEGTDSAEELINMVLYNEYGYASGYSYTGMAMTGEGFIDKRLAAEPEVVNANLSYIWFYNDSADVNPSFVGKLSNIDSKDITWLNGEKKTLGEKEIIATTDLLYSFGTVAEAEEEGAPEQIDLKAVADAKLQIGLDNIITREFLNEDGYKIVGVIDNISKQSNYQSAVIVCDSIYDKHFKQCEGEYINALGAMPQEKEDIKALAAYCYNDESAVRYEFNNPVSYELDTVNQVLNLLSKIFLYIGLGFALFAAILMANFIATSISYKKQEIGILRAIGSRSNDVFRIFFAESFIIAMINFLLSAIGVGVATAIINGVLRAEAGILITVLHFGIRQIILLLAVSVLVAALASFFPVKKIASKRPIDAIRNR